MKNFLPAFLPALVLLALGGCASTSGLATTEPDGVYYSATDRTTAIASTYQGQEYSDQGGSTASQPQTDEAANPDYNYNTNGAGAAINNNGSSAQYYDNSYDRGYNNGYNNGRYNSSYYAPGVAYYAPLAYAPYTTLSYGWGGGYCGYSPYGSAFCNPYYSPFYGSGVSISIGYGFGSPYGYYGYGRPYGYGGFYDSFYYSRYYGGYYGYGGGYYGGRRNVIYTGNGHYYGDGGSNTVIVGPRRGRGGDVVTGGRPAAQPGSPSSGPGRTGGRAAVSTGESSLPDNPNGGRLSGMSPSSGRTGRVMSETPVANPNNNMPDGSRGNVTPTQPDTRQPANYGEPRIGRVRSYDANGMGQVNTQPAPQPQNADVQPTRRGGLFGGGEQRAQPQRSYEQPQRSYEQPQRSAEQPQRSYGGGDGGGGGNSGGGGRRGR